MKYTSIAVLAVLGLTNAHRHHHHHHSLAQGEDKPAVTPDSNRANFEKSVKTAANVVSTEHSSENDRTSTHSAAMASQYQSTYDKNAATRTKYVNNNVENNVTHKQWVLKNRTNNWAQVESEAYGNPDANRGIFDTSVSNAAAVVAEQKKDEAESNATIEKNQNDARAATTAKKNGVVAARMNQTRNNVKKSRDSRGWRLVWPVGSLAQGSPDDNAKARTQAVEDAAEATKIQRAAEAQNTETITTKHADAASESAEYSTHSKQEIDNVGRGGVHAARDALGWRMQTGSYGSPEDSYKARKMAVDDAAEATKIQRASEASNVEKITTNHADAASESAEYSTHSKQEIDNVGRGGVHAARDALGWRMQTGSQDTINPAGYEEHVAAFVKPNIIYQSNDKSDVKW